MAWSPHVRDSGFRNAGRIWGHPEHGKSLLVKSEIYNVRLESRIHLESGIHGKESRKQACSEP